MKLIVGYPIVMMKLIMKALAKGKRMSAWELARRYGVDMAQLAANLRKSPAERLAQHQKALAVVMSLRDGVKKRHA